MPQQSSHPDLLAPEDALVNGDELRLLSRSPHPYSKQNHELLEPAGRLGDNGNQRQRPSKLPKHDAFTKESTPTGSDSGTEADDEHFLKGLPAPRPRLHKGLKSKSDRSGASSPLRTPDPLEAEARFIPPVLKRDVFLASSKTNVERAKRAKEITRRSTEVLMLAWLGGMLLSNPGARSLVHQWRRGKSADVSTRRENGAHTSVEYLAQAGIFSTLLVLYPIRLALWAYRERSPSKWLPISVPTSFDPAPLLYPTLIPLFASLLLAANSTAAHILPNLILSLCSLPRALFPAARAHELYSPVHWMVSCLPIFVAENNTSRAVAAEANPLAIDSEVGVLLYPLHQTMTLILERLTTTSLLPAELQLLSVSLVDLLLLASSPQAVILKAILWGGLLGLLFTCCGVVKWGITLARVPRWRFRRVPIGGREPSFFESLPGILALRKVKDELLGAVLDETSCESGNATDDGDGRQAFLDSHAEPKLTRISTGLELNGHAFETIEPAGHAPAKVQFQSSDGIAESLVRRHTLPSLTAFRRRSKTHTASGRRKRAASSSVRAFFILTYNQAVQRRRIYAGWLYFCIVAIILGPVREYIGRYALKGEEPIGWALGYLFGDLPKFRFQVVSASLERWIPLPPLVTTDGESCRLGWVENLRQNFLGEANTRLFLCGYFLAIIACGLGVVFSLSPVVEVDTRRKVFHFMMVAMFLPATFVDPPFAALALAAVLAVFLILDLLRASQLPPLSKPIASFLTPYVDGRDLRGPVVISHIFLLIGCAIPLWLSLAALPRVGEGALAGWDVPARDVSMVSGVVCVGLGDAAASLIGRRWGHRKWRWGGGKSLEGSAAFAAAVFAGLMAAAFWLRLGGWRVAGETNQGLPDWAWGRSAAKAGVCANLASLTEAVLTGGNDNVVVPVVLWMCVKSIGV
jgi:dolichol kinase